jgi:hypothetical protein
VSSITKTNPLVPFREIIFFCSSQETNTYTLLTKWIIHLWQLVIHLNTTVLQRVKEISFATITRFIILKVFVPVSMKNYRWRDLFQPCDIVRFITRVLPFPSSSVHYLRFTCFAQLLSEDWGSNFDSNTDKWLLKNTTPQPWVPLH